MRIFFSLINAFRLSPTRFKIELAFLAFFFFLSPFTIPFSRFLSIPPLLIRQRLLSFPFLLMLIQNILDCLRPPSSLSYIFSSLIYPLSFVFPFPHIFYFFLSIYFSPLLALPSIIWFFPSSFSHSFVYFHYSYVIFFLFLLITSSLSIFFLSLSYLRCQYFIFL